MKVAEVEFAWGGSEEEASPSPSDLSDSARVNEVSIKPVNNAELNGDLASDLRKTRAEDRRKGQAVSRQIVRLSV